MTCIVGLTEEGKVYIGADGLGISDSGKTRINTYKKVFRVGDALIGYCGSVKMGQILQYHFTPPALDGNDVHRYMARYFVQSMQECFDNAKLKEDDRGQILVGFKGRLFLIDGSNYQVEEDIGGYHAIGCAADIALGAIWATRDRDIPAESRIEVALRASADHNAHVRGPFLIESI